MKSFLILFFVLVAGIARSAVVYDNFHFELGSSFYYPNGPTYVIADDASLSGPERTVTSIDTYFTVGSPPVSGFTATLTASLYQMNGSGMTWTVGSLLGSGSTILSYPAVGIYAATVPIPNVVVPDDVILAFSITNYNHLDSGVTIYGQASVGSSAGRLARDTGSGWVYENGQQNNVEFRINAAPVPEPASLAFLAVALVGLRNRRNRAL